MIKTIGLTKSFNEKLAVDRLTLEVEQGEVFGFLGPNGAGKTTTVRMLATLIEPSAGSANVLGYEVGRDDREIRRHIGILTESPGHYDRLSAWRNLNIYAELYEVDRPKEQAEKYLRWLDLWDRKDDPAGAFSKGMRQKLAIARAMMHEPKVLFLDEPTAGLDPESAKLVRDFIEELKGKGRTIFMCTHNLDEADRLCDRIAVFKTRLQAVDSPSGLRRKVYGRQVVFHLEKVDERYIQLLQSLSFIHQVETVDNKIVISLDNPEEDNPEIIRQLVSTGANIQFVGEVRHTLEDIYLQMLK